MTEDPDGGPRDYDQERAEAQWDHEVCLGMQQSIRFTQGQWNGRARWILGRLFLTWEVPKSGDISETIRSLRRAGRR